MLLLAGTWVQPGRGRVANLKLSRSVVPVGHPNVLPSVLPLVFRLVLSSALPTVLTLVLPIVLEILGLSIVAPGRKCSPEALKRASLLHLQ